MGIGWTEILLILGVALVVLGPSKLPGVARTLGRAVREFRSSIEDLGREVDDGRDAAKPRAAPPGEENGRSNPDEPDGAS